MTVQTGPIAIVDDDAIVRRASARLLEGASYRVRTYGAAREFIDSLRLEAPACLIVDMQMDDMTGDEILHYLAGAGTRIPTIVLTGHGDTHSRERCMQAGAVAFLLKPVSPDQLLTAIEAALGHVQA